MSLHRNFGITQRDHFIRSHAPLSVRRRSRKSYIFAALAIIAVLTGGMYAAEFGNPFSIHQE
jgi:hypothetical protein